MTSIGPARLLASLPLLLASACTEPESKRQPPAPPAASAKPLVDDRADERARLVRIVRSRGVTDERVLEALGRVPRHELVPSDVRAAAYADHPLAIGEDQTISQPTVVGMMTQLASVNAGDRVLEVGTGSGYQAAVLAELGARVYTIEIVGALGKRAAADLARLGYHVQTRIGDGYRGWPGAAPFDAIVVTAAPPKVPEPLKAQLKVGGRLVLPVGPQHGRQMLRVITRTADGFTSRDVTAVRFVPMTGEVQDVNGEAAGAR